MMRIAIFHNLPSGGAKRALYEWTRLLSASHRIDVYSLSTANHNTFDIHPFAQNYRVFDFIPRREFESPWGRLNRLQRWRDLGYLTTLSRRIAQEINCGGYDVVFAHPCLYTFMPILIRFIEIPTVFFLHEPFGPTFERQFERPYLKNSTRWREISKRLDPFFILYHHRLEKARTASVKEATLLLANSKFTQGQIKLQYGVHAPVCYCGVNVKDFRPLPDIRKENTVISVGSLAPHKGFDFLIKSLAHIPPKQRPVLKLVSNWASPEERRYLKDLADRYHVDLRILVDLDTHQLLINYNKSTLCVYAPIKESLGLVPLESMACGTPVVGVAEGGVRETIRHGETGLLTDRDPEQFALAVQKLLSNPELALEYGNNGRQFILRNWTWSRSVSTLESHLVACARQVQQNSKE